jgi:hypothetical protein
MRARVLARLAEAGLYTGDLASAADASRAALAAARDCGDPGALVAALRARHTVCGGPDGASSAPSWPPGCSTSVGRRTTRRRRR